MPRHSSRPTAFRGLIAAGLTGLAIFLSPPFHAAFLDLFPRGGAEGHVIEHHAAFNPVVVQIGLFTGDRFLELLMLIVIAALALPPLSRLLGYALPLGALMLVPALAALMRGHGLDGVIAPLCLFAAAMVLRRPPLALPLPVAALSMLAISLAMTLASPLHRGTLGTLLVALLAPLPALALTGLGLRFRNR